MVALSSTEAEFKRMVKGLCEILWLKELLTEIEISAWEGIELFCDNQAAIEIASNMIKQSILKLTDISLKRNLKLRLFNFLSLNQKSN